MVVVGTLSIGLLETFFCLFYGYYSWVVLSSSIILTVVVGSLSEGLLETFFCVFYGYYSWVFSQFFNNFAGSERDFERRTS